MAKRKYKVIRPWVGVKAGQVVQMEKLHPSLKANVIPLDDDPTLEPATPAAGTGNAGNDRKSVIVARLKELNIEFDGRKGAEDLAALLPNGEMEKLFPAE